MNSRCNKRIVFLEMIFVALTMVGNGHASIYGRISGSVRDKKTHDPLVGATVVLEGTQLGATTDLNGRYVIIKIPPSQYTIRVSYVGYSTTVVKNVRVVQDNMTQVNVELTQSNIGLKGVTIEVARTPLIRADVSGSQVIVSGSSIQSRPSESIQSALATMPGIVSFNGQLYARGSRATDIRYIIDGVPVTNPINHTLMTDVNGDAVQDMEVLTGGFSAQYGNALGGIVNLTTKDGGPKLAGSLRYKTDNPLVSSEYYNDQNIWDGTFGGPLIGQSRFFLTFYLNTQATHAGREVIAPSGVNLGRPPHDGDQDYNGTAKFMFPIGNEIRLHLLGSINRDQAQMYSPFWQFGSDPNQLDRLGATFDKTMYGAATLDQTLNQKTYYSLTVGYLHYEYIQGELDRSQWSGNAMGIQTPWWQDFKFRTPFLNTNYHVPGNPNAYSKWQWMDSEGPANVVEPMTGDSVSVNNPWGVPGGLTNTVDASYFQNFVYGGDNGYYEHDVNQQLSARFDLTTQPATDNELQLGFNVTQYWVGRFVISGMGTYNGVGVSYPVIDFYQKDPSDTGLSVTNGNDLGPGYTPISLAAYVQDQFHFSGMYINAGLRYDYYNAQTNYRINPIDPSQANPFLQPRAYSRPQSQLSPRVGVSFPITDRIVLRFNYGLFFQRPSMDNMFSYLWNNFNQADVNQGNPNIAAERTTAYELGSDWRVSKNMVLNITAFNKENFNLEGYRMVLGPNLHWFFQDQNKEYGNSYGIEFSLTRRYSKWISGTVNYTLSWAKGTSSTVTEMSRYPITAATFAKSLGYQPLYPENLMPMDFDRRNVVNLDLDFSIPVGEGPVILGSKLLGGVGFDLVGNYESGTPYTPQTSFFVTVTSDMYNSANFPPTASLDMKIHKDFLTWQGLRVSIFADIYNVLNLDMPFAVFKGSGNPSTPLYLVSLGDISPDSYPSTSPLYSKAADTNNDGVLTPQERLAAYQLLQKDMLAMMPNYPLPRTFEFGIKLDF